MVQSQARQQRYLQTCEPDFLRFLREGIANIIRGNVPIKKSLLFPYESQLSRLSNQTLTHSERRKLLSGKKGIELVNIVAKPIIKKLDRKS